MAENQLKPMKALVDRLMDATKAERAEMDRHLKRFKGEWWNEHMLDASDSRIFVNMVFSTIMTIAPHLTANRLQWSAKARLPFFQNYINGWKMSADYLWDQQDLDFKLVDAVISSLAMKLGIWKVYFDPGDDGDGDLSIDAVDPRTFFSAPGYDDIWDSPLCGTLERKPVSWIRKHFPKSGASVKSSNKTDKDVGEQEPFEYHDQFCNFYTVWFRDYEAETFYVKDENGQDQEKKKAKYPYGRFCYFTDDVWLADQPCEYRHNKPPYVLLYNYRIPFQLTGGGEVDQIESLNQSLNRNLQLLDRYAAWYSDPPIFVDANSGVDFEEFKSKYKEGGGVFSFNAMALNGSTPVFIPDQKPMNRAVMDQMGILPRYIEEISGTPDITKGQVGKQQRQSATEIGTIAEFGMGRTRGRVGNLEHFLKRAYYLILSLQMQYYTEPRYFSYRNTEGDNGLQWESISNTKMTAGRMVGPSKDMNPQEATEAQQSEIQQDQKDFEDFVQFTKDLGDMDPVFAAFDLEVQTTTTLPLDQQSLANLYLRLLQMAGANPVTGMPMWKAALRNLKIPGYREIIDEMEKLFQSQQKGPQGQAPPGPESPLTSLLQSGGTST